MAYEDYKRECEAVSIEVKRYRVDGIPTCESWHEGEDRGDELCRFLGARSFGQTKVCMVTGDDLCSYAGGSIKRPCESCPVWNYEKEIQPVIDKLRINGCQ